MEPRESPRHLSPSRLAAAAVLLLALLGASTASADSSTAADEEPATASAAATSGLVVFVDPDTGEILDRPLSGQLEALSKAISARIERSDAGLVPFALDNGGRGVFLGDRFATATVARRSAGGGHALSCSDPGLEPAPGPAPDGAPLEEK